MKPTISMQVYAEKVFIEADNQISNVILQGIDVGNVLQNFSLEEVLENYDVADLHAYVAKRIAEDREMED